MGSVFQWGTHLFGGLYTLKEIFIGAQTLLHDKNTWKKYVQVLYFAENGCFGGKISIRSHFEKPRAPIFGIVGVQVFILFIYFDFSSEVNK